MPTSPPSLNIPRPRHRVGSPGWIWDEAGATSFWPPKRPFRQRSEVDSSVSSMWLLTEKFRRRQGGPGGPCLHGSGRYWFWCGGWWLADPVSQAEGSRRVKRRGPGPLRFGNATAQLTFSLQLTMSPMQDARRWLRHKRAGGLSPPPRRQPVQCCQVPRVVPAAFPGGCQPPPPQPCASTVLGLAQVPAPPWAALLANRGPPPLVRHDGQVRVVVHLRPTQAIPRRWRVT